MLLSGLSEKSELRDQTDPTTRREVGFRFTASELWVKGKFKR